MVTGAPGFGKTSVLNAAASKVVAKAGMKLLWVNGGIVGSEAHLARMISSAKAQQDPVAKTPSSRESLGQLFCELGRGRDRPWLLAVDDVDALFFKREELAALVAEALLNSDEMQFLGTCHPSVGRRLTQTSSFGRALKGQIPTIRIGLFTDAEARELVDRRVPNLPGEVSAVVVREAGGHPAALVFLARLASIHFSQASSRGNGSEEFLDRAGELAGSVYAESWALRSPQQRAILWQLGTSATPAKAAVIAAAVELRAPQVSAQIKRLIDEGLVLPTAQRAHYTVAPLLARWIALRATRGRDLARDLKKAAPAA